MLDFIVEWSWAVALSIPVAFLIWQSTFQYGWLEMALGGGAGLFWTGALIWLVATVISVRSKRRWWALITTPLLAYPVVMSILLLMACYQGNCL